MRWYNNNPASCTGNIYAYVSPILLWECHKPGGVINIPPWTQFILIGFNIFPFSSNSSPTSVYIFSLSLQLIHKSRATELCLWGFWTVLGGNSLYNAHKTGVIVFTPILLVSLLLNKIPFLLLFGFDNFNKLSNKNSFEYIAVLNIYFTGLFTK